jgi:hypothetical protein
MRYLVLVLLVTFVVGCETTYYTPRQGPPAHAPAHGYHKKHVYHYYPDAEIYLSVELGTFTVFEGGRWVTVRGRPTILTSAHKYVVIRVDNKDPWRNHSHHKRMYPPGQLKQHARGKGNGKGKGQGGRK